MGLIGSKTKTKKFTYADYLTWPDEQRCELIDGVVYDMTPSPVQFHQEILLELSWQFNNYFRGKTCKLFFAPFDVRFSKNKNANSLNESTTDTVVQPDLLVVCDPSKLDGRGCLGAPDLVVEILSPSTSAKDRLTKLNLYEKHGVKEYWIVSPDAGSIMIFRLQKDLRYGKPGYACWSETITTPLFPGLTVDLTTVFPADPEKTVREPPAKYEVKKKAK
ncbi:MAG: Uma2 family endonuclease [Candidatus Ozemobacteraceae bacterium]